MTKDEFLTRYADELSGLLLASFVESFKTNDFTNNGQFMKIQMRRARDLLTRIHADLTKEKDHGANLTGNGKAAGPAPKDQAKKP